MNQVSRWTSWADEPVGQIEPVAQMKKLDRRKSWTDEPGEQMKLDNQLNQFEQMNQLGR